MYCTGRRSVSPAETVVSRVEGDGTYRAVEVVTGDAASCHRPDAAGLMRVVPVNTDVWPDGDVSVTDAFVPPGVFICVACVN